MSGAAYDGSIAAGIAGTFMLATRAYDKWRKNKPVPPTPTEERKQLADEWREYREALAEERRQLGEDVNECNRKIMKLQQALDERDAELRRLRAENADKSAQIADLERRVKAQEQRPN